VIEEELGVTTRADELGGLTMELLAVGVERTGAARVVVVVDVLMDIVVREVVLVAVAVMEVGVIEVVVVVAVEVVIEVVEVAVVAELLVDDDVVLVAIS
jgi:hypothetical protein